MQPEKGLLQQVIGVTSSWSEAQAEAVQAWRKAVAERLEGAVVTACIPPHQLTELLETGIHVE